MNLEKEGNQLEIVPSKRSQKEKRKKKKKKKQKVGEESRESGQGESSEIAKECIERGTGQCRAAFWVF